MHTTYLKQFIAFLILLTIPICGNWMFLFNSGEFLSFEDIVERQLASKYDFPVGLGTRNPGYYYKQEMYQRLKPDILILGSSRVMEFRKEFFSSSVLNAGIAMSSINEGFSFLKTSLKYHVPKLIIIGIDYWWFNEKYMKPVIDIRPPLPSNKFSLRTYLLPYKWLWQKKITFEQYLTRLNPFYRFYHNLETGIGVNGIFNKNGFAQDGSYLYTAFVIGKEKSIDEKFQVNFGLIKDNVWIFEKNNYVNSIHFNNFLNMLAYLKEQNIQVILFIPSIAPTVLNKIPQFSIIEDLRQKLKKANISFYDFHDPAVIQGNDCEFIDGIHGGDVLYAKMLAAILKDKKELQSYINVAYLDKVIHYFNDLAMIPRPYLTKEPEVDFLDLGCNKLNALAHQDAIEKSIAMK